MPERHVRRATDSVYSFASAACFRQRLRLRLSGTDRIRRHHAEARLEGTILRRHGRHTLLVAVEFLQTGASVQIEDCDVETVA
jgi:hypothetical protein